MRQSNPLLSYMMPKQGFVCCQICTLDRCFDNQSQEELTDTSLGMLHETISQLRVKVPSTKSSVILAASQLYLTVLMCFPPPACSGPLFVLLFVHMDVQR